MIKAVIFDFGNVLSMPQTGNCFTEMEAKTGIPAAVFRESLGTCRNQFDLGTITAAELYASVLQEHGYKKEAADKQLCTEIGNLDLKSWSTINAQVNEWALNLQKQGFKLGILSNMPEEFLALYEKSVPAFTAADYAVFSCRVNIIKPNPAIYRIALNGLYVQPEEAVFFDDIPANIEAARSLGIHGIIWENLSQAQKEFELLQ